MKKGKKTKDKKETSFLTKTILFLRLVKERLSSLRPIHRISERQKALAHYSDSEGYEESRISYIFGISKVISVFLLVLLLAITVIFGSGVISYEKMYYMFKDVTYIKNYEDGEPLQLSYSHPVQNQVFADYKNGLLVAGDSELKFFTSTGRVSLTAGSEFTNPRVVCSNSNALIYDQGRHTFSIYNSFVKLYSEKTEYQISSVDMSDNGSYLIVTSSNTYNSTVKFYDANYAQTGEYNKNSWVISAKLSSNGRYAAILSLSAKNGASEVNLDILDCKNTEIISKNTYQSSMPYMCEFLSDNTIAIFFTDGFRLVDRKGNLKNEYAYPSSVENIDVRNDSFAIFFSESEGMQQKMLEVFDDNGNKIFARQISGNVRDVKLGDGCVYLLKANEIIRINTSLGTESRIDSRADNLRIVVLSDGRALVCSQNSASYISFD